MKEKTGKETSKGNKKVSDFLSRRSIKVVFYLPGLVVQELDKTERRMLVCPDRRRLSLRENPLEKLNVYRSNSRRRR
jgi:hypothetical protein